jgi:hypothetical protein
LGVFETQFVNVVELGHVEGQISRKFGNASFGNRPAMRAPALSDHATFTFHRTCYR